MQNAAVHHRNHMRIERNRKPIKLMFIAGVKSNKTIDLDLPAFL